MIGHRMKIDLEWVKRQFVAKRVSQASGTAVLRLLELWNTMNHTEATAKETVDVFSKVALGHALVEESDEVVWEAVRPGFIKTGDTVRVRSDAFDGEIGLIHNGRIGRVVAIRYGDIIVRSTDGLEPLLDGTHYSPHMLERKVSL